MRIILSKIFLVTIIFSQHQLFAQPETLIYRDAQERLKKGISHYENALYGQAIEELEAALATDNNMLSTQNTAALFHQAAEYYIALSALKLTRPDAEKRILLFIQNNEPSSWASKAKLEVGHYYYSKRDYDKTILFLSKISWPELSGLNNEEVAKAKFELGYSYFVKKQFQQSIPLFEQVKGTESKYAESAQYYYGLCKFFQKDYKTALKSFEQIAESKKYQEIVTTYIVQIHFMLKNYDEVIKFGEPLLSNENVKERQSIVQAVGQAHFEKGNYKKALPYIEEHVSKMGKVTEDIFYQLAYTQYRSEKYQDAIQNFEQINDLNNQMGQNALYYQASCQLKLGKKKEALFNFQQASQKTFNSQMQQDALYNYAKLSYELGFDNDAISAFMAIPAQSEYYSDAQFLLSKIFLNTRDYDKALEILRSIKNRNPSLQETYQKVAYFRGIQYFKENNFNKAIELFNESLKVAVHNESTALSHYWKAESLFLTDRFDLSLQEYEKFLLVANAATALPPNSSKGTAYYGIAYNYLRKNEYNLAGLNFEASFKFIEDKLKNTKDKYVTNFVYPDAIIRAADCFMYNGSDNKENYLKAGKYYQKVIDNNYPYEDYAMYQLSLIYNVTNNSKKQIQITDKLLTDFPESPYVDDALYNKGNVQILQGELSDAKITFDDLIIKYPASEYKNRSMYKLGIISYSKNYEREALDYFKAVVKNNIQTEEAKEALSYIRKIYIEQGDPDGFMAFVSTIQGYNFTDMEADSLLYESAERIFDQDNWSLAIENYSKYLDRFPRGLNSLSARYNRGISHFNLKQYDKAIIDFTDVSDAKNPSAPTEIAWTANFQVARISYNIDKNFEKAVKYYKRTLEFPVSEETKLECLLLGLRSAFYSNNNTELVGFSEKYLNEPAASIQTKAETYYYLGKQYLDLKKYDLALSNFEEVVKLISDDERAAESRYRIAEINYLKANTKKAMEIATQNNKQISYNKYWLAKNLILISDIFVTEGNNDAAKGTLESLLKNYKEDQELINEAKTKLDNIKKGIQSKSRLKSGDEDSDIEMIEDEEGN